MRYVITVLAVLVTACYTVNGVRNTPPGEGDEQLYRADVREAALAVRNAVTSTSLEIVEAAARGEGQWYVMARGPSGEMVRVVCEDIGAGVVAVRVIIRQDLLDGHWEWAGTIFAQVDLELDRALD